MRALAYSVSVDVKARVSGDIELLWYLVKFRVENVLEYKFSAHAVVIATLEYLLHSQSITDREESSHIRSQIFSHSSKTSVVLGYSWRLQSKPT
jgi:hypothetical protein